MSPMLLKDVYHEMKEALHNASVDTPALDSRLIIEERAGYDWSDIVAGGRELVIDSHVYEQICIDVQERINGKPISRIYNKREFWGQIFLRQLVSSSMPR